jgi:hypothetical protein
MEAAKGNLIFWKKEIDARAIQVVNAKSEGCPSLFGD